MMTFNDISDVNLYITNNSNNNFVLICLLGSFSIILGGGGVNDDVYSMYVSIYFNRLK